MKALFLRWGHLLAILCIPLQGSIYVLLGSNTGSDVFYNYAWIDTQIPFIKEFIYPYVSWMPILYLGFLYLGLTNKSLFWRMIITYNVGVIAANIVFAVFPTYVPRPEAIGTGLSSTLVQFIYTNDAPYNCFPSIHCLTSYLLFIIINRHLNFKPMARISWSIWLWLIIASTVFVKQHSLLDVAGGILFGEAAYWAVHVVAVRAGLASKKTKQPLTATNTSSNRLV
ncbi:phosphatase PAP2 family protein [Paenibacillus sp. E222]|uniref:phosphatase PAP2 family protein n=1 Tax=Paenibacillus sp. E222 TaxID=2748863 RepID=UPI0015C5A69F|nr:phosphatase PAP2 family protein [Paenibacillus sp. E222]QLG37348.1 phosphatase PAP2 family protein [Paenibacillus sp. E222]